MGKVCKMLVRPAMMMVELIKKTGGRARGGRVDNAKTFTDQNGQDSK